MRLLKKHLSARTVTLGAFALTLVACRAAPAPAPAPAPQAPEIDVEALTAVVERAVADVVPGAVERAVERALADREVPAPVAKAPLEKPEQPQIVRTRPPQGVRSGTPRTTRSLSYDDRYGDKLARLAATGGTGTRPTLERALEFLARVQRDDGSWAGDGWGDQPSAEARLVRDVDVVGITGLALLAFLGDGNTLEAGPHRDVVARAVHWLRQQQKDSGLVGKQEGHSFLYDHGIATLALAEAYHATRSPLLEASVTKAAAFIQRARNPYGAWRYDVPPIGDNDTSVTTWMVAALKAVEAAGISVDTAAYDGALNWINEATDPATGRVGYDSTGSRSSRVVNINDHFPPERGEGMTAAGLFCRILLGQHPDSASVLKQHADLLMTALPEWDTEGYGCDMYYWYYGSHALRQMGGEYWRAWNLAMQRALLDSQRTDGEHEGSWDPVGPWSYSGGRTYSTALLALCLESYYRYDSMLGD